jgi:hypothetical protein
MNTNLFYFFDYQRNIYELNIYHEFNFIRYIFIKVFELTSVYARDFFNKLSTIVFEHENINFKIKTLLININNFI